MIRRFLARRRHKQALRAHHAAILAQAEADAARFLALREAHRAAMHAVSEAPERHDGRAHIDAGDPDCIDVVPDCLGCVINPGHAA